MPQRTDRTFLEIDISAIYRNLSVYANRCRGKKIIAVLKDSCYGHGGLLARYISDRIDAIGVSTVEEGYLMRQLCPDLPILIFGYAPLNEVPRLIHENLSATVYSFRQASELNARAQGVLGRLKVHVKIDSGMRRLGFPSGEEAAEILGLGNLDCVGIYSHYAVSPSEDEGYFARQTERFNAAASYCVGAGASFEFMHIANSAAADAASAGNAVRIGYGLYGYGDGLTPALSWRARVVRTAELKKGDTVGYGRSYTAERRVRIATVAAGYGDGFPRDLSNRGYVLFKDRLLPIVGRVCMDMLTVDVSGTGIRQGDYVTLIGGEGEKKITAEDLGFGYEVLCGISPRVPRYYVI